MFNQHLSTYDVIIRDLKKLNLVNLEKLKAEVSKEIAIKTDIEKTKLSEKETMSKLLKEKYDNDLYVCIYQPHNSYNWLIEENPNFDEPLNLGISLNCLTQFVLKTDLHKFIK